MLRKLSIGSLSTFIILGLLGAKQVQADPKIGVVNFQKLLEQAPQTKFAMSSLENEFAPRRTSLLAMQSQAKTSSDESFKADFQRKAGAFQDDAKRRRDEEIKKVQQFLVRQIQSYGSKEGYGMVLGDGVFFAGSKLDITENVLAVLRTEPSDLSQVPAVPPSTSTSFTSGDNYKIGVVNFQKLLEEVPQTKYAMNNLENEFARRRTSLLAMQNQAKTSSDNAFRENFQRQATAFQNDAKTRRDEEIGKVQKFLVKQIQEYGRVQQFDMLLGDGVFFAKGPINATAGVQAVAQTKPNALPAEYDAGTGVPPSLNESAANTPDSTDTTDEAVATSPPVNTGPSGMDIFAALLTGAAQGVQNGIAARNGGRITNVPVQTYTPPTTAQAANSNQGGNGGMVWQDGMKQCIRIVANQGGGSDFVNGCNATVTIEWFVGQTYGTADEAPATADIGPGRTQPVTAFLPFKWIDYAVCRKGYGFYTGDRQRIWTVPNTPFSCGALATQ